jgi:hypothetical protein
MSNLAYEQNQGQRKARRSSIRRALKLQSVTVFTEHSSQRGTVLDLSENGMLIEVGKPIAIFSNIKVDLPETRNIQATVVWVSGKYIGCQFAETLARHVFSASLLRADPRETSYHMIESYIKTSDLGSLELDTPKLSLHSRLIILCGASVLLWGSIVLSVTSLAF